ncbi:MAG: hypothetical protein HUU19_12920 [Phycisphaerales bacterium]|nr:hypothetical protein [Phycisphaerales bacterium]
MRISKLTLIAGICAVASGHAAHAAIVSMGPFAGAYSEGFEGRSFYWTSGTTPVFGGAGTMHERNMGTLILTGSWSFRTVVRPYEGRIIMGSPGGWMEYNFNQDMSQFGGYFATNSGTPDGRAEFYKQGALVGSQTLAAPASGAWTWNGWRSDTGFDTVHIIGNYTSGGFIMQDALQASPLPAPGAAALVGCGVVAVVRRRRNDT